MPYETIVQLSQTAALLFFVLLFVAVLVYALRPKNRGKFERAARIPLNSDAGPAEHDQRTGERNG